MEFASQSYNEVGALGLQGGPAQVRPTYIFAGNIILVTFECIGKIQWFLANVITV